MVRASSNVGWAMNAMSGGVASSDLAGRRNISSLVGGVDRARPGRSDYLCPITARG